MPLLGKAAMVLSFDIVAEAIAEHDDWHTHEHFPERLSIPGFLRGSRWIAQEGQPRYLVLYEVRDLAILDSAAYLERLNHPTPWTTKMMASYRGMTRGLCVVTGSFGLGVGQAGLLLRFKAAPGKEAGLRAWLVGEALPRLPAQAGLAGAHLFEAGLQAAITNEQRIRGRDAAVDWALLVTGYSSERIAALAAEDLHPEQLERHGASAATAALYRMEFSLSELEAKAHARTPVGPL